MLNSIQLLSNGRINSKQKPLETNKQFIYFLKNISGGILFIQI